MKDRLRQIFWLVVEAYWYARTSEAESRAAAEGLKHTDPPCECCMRSDYFEARRREAGRYARAYAFYARGGSDA